MNIPLLICAFIFLAIGILAELKNYLKQFIAVIKDAREYLKERKELKWM